MDDGVIPLKNVKDNTKLSAQHVAHFKTFYNLFCTYMIYILLSDVKMASKLQSLTTVWQE